MLRCLNLHPEIVSPPPLSIGMALHHAARSAMRQGSRNDIPTTVAVGRRTGAMALAALFQDARRGRPGSRVAILHDPTGPLFPFLDPPEISLLVLTRSAAAMAAAIGAAGVERVVTAASDALTAAQSRVSSFGLPPERTITIDQDSFDGDPAPCLAELCDRLYVAGDAGTIASMLDLARIDACTKGGA